MTNTSPITTITFLLLLLFLRTTIAIAIAIATAIAVAVVIILFIATVVIAIATDFCTFSLDACRGLLFMCFHLEDTLKPKPERTSPLQDPNIGAFMYFGGSLY